MIEKAINKIVELCKPEVMDINGRRYTNKGIIPVKEPLPSTLVVHTLSSLVDYLKKSIDNLEKKSLVIHVVSPVEVNLLGFLNNSNFCERAEFLSAIYEPPRFEYDRYTSLEDFIINLQANFVNTDKRADILKVIGNLKDESVRQFEDDGITQAVKAKSGIAIVENVAVPNPVTLKPFRTFPEVEQPESLFVFRMKQQNGNPPACGLWEADNKQWKLEAIKNIAEWLKDKFDVPIIA